jgi:hypothetical protein
MSGDEAVSAAEWLLSGDTGLSSEAIMAWMLGAREGRFRHPHDPADLGRCLRLLDRIPEWRARLGEMAAASPQWSALVGVWAELEGLYREEEPTGNAPRCFRRMREVLGR